MTEIDVEIIADGLGFPEGPVALADGSVILTDIRNARCVRVAADGTVSLFSDTGGGPNGLAFGPDGALYSCNNGGGRYVEGHAMSLGPHPDYRHGWISRLDPRNGAQTLLYTHVAGHALSAPNDLVFDAAGGFYFTDLGKRYARHRDHGGVYYARPDGTGIHEVAYPMLSPNGCGLSPDGRTLYVADTEGARLWAFEVVEPGRLASKGGHAPQGGRLVTGLPGAARFDSLAVMASGNICIAVLETGVVVELTPNGRRVREVKTPDIYPTNICFGGTDMRTAYVTLSQTGRLGRMRWPEPGLKLHFG